MIYVIVLALIALVAIQQYLLHRKDEQHAEVLADQAKAAESERRELLNRLAQPGLVALGPEQMPKARPPKDMRDFRRIGTVQPPQKEPADA